MDPHDDDEIRRLAEAQRQTSTAVERLQFELSGHIKDMVRPVGDFYAYVMEPTNGLLARHRDLEQRVAIIEARAREASDRRQWALREILGVGAMLLAVAILSAWLTAKFLGK